MQLKFTEEFGSGEGIHRGLGLLRIAKRQGGRITAGGQFFRFQLLTLNTMSLENWLIFFRRILGRRQFRG